MNWTGILAAAAAVGLTAPLPVLAQGDPNHHAAGMNRHELHKSSTNMIGEPITYPSDAAEITTEIVVFEPGGRTGYHSHPIPSWVYVLEGELEVRIDGQEPMHFMEGQAFVEPQNINMQAFNTAEGLTKLLMVSIGAEAQPTGQPAMPVTE